MYGYDYDSRGRLSDVTTNSTSTAHYDYDDNGNRTGGFNLQGAISAAYDEQDRLTEYTAGPTTAAYTYNINGELETKTVGSETTAYLYDVVGNLLDVTSTSGPHLAYEVDARNRRIGRKVNGSRTGGLLYDGQLTPIAEVAADGITVTGRFVYATKSSLPDYVVRDGVTYRILSDYLGSPRLVIDATTSGLTVSQRIAQHLEHDEFGNVTVDVVASGFTRLPFGFAGGVDDPTTGLVRFGVRDYDSTSGRWTAKDSLGFAAGDSNLFAYVANDPVNHVDPNGHDFFLAGVTARSAMMGAVFGAASSAAFNVIPAIRDGCEIDLPILVYQTAAGAALGAISGGRYVLPLLGGGATRLDYIAETLAAFHLGFDAGAFFGIIQPIQNCERKQ